MNYLSHYHYNHAVCGRPALPYFVMGVALPDLWSRFSRRKRIRWKSVSAATPRDPVGAPLRAGLLNHIEADRWFHALPAFVRMQRSTRARVEMDSAGGGISDLLAHLAVELALDHALLRRIPALADEFYDRLAECDSDEVARSAGELGDVDTRGLDAVIDGFVSRRYLREYRRPDGLIEAMQLILSQTAFGGQVPRGWIERLVCEALRCADPDEIWSQIPNREAIARQVR